MAAITYIVKDRHGQWHTNDPDPAFRLALSFLYPDDRLYYDVLRDRYVAMPSEWNEDETEWKRGSR